MIVSAKSRRGETAFAVPTSDRRPLTSLQAVGLYEPDGRSLFSVFPPGRRPLWAGGYFLLSNLAFLLRFFAFYFAVPSRLHPQPRDRGQLSLVLIESEKIRSSQRKR